jgi:hypothetical protein
MDLIIVLMIFLYLLIGFVKETYGIGVGEFMEDLETHQQPIDPLQSPHLPEEPTGNKLVVAFGILHQSRLMEPYGLGDMGHGDYLQTEQQQVIYPLQSPHFLEELIGNK